MVQKTRRPRIRKFVVPPYVKAALPYMLPPEDLSVSQWAEQYRILDSRSSALPGPWSNDKTPYLVEIMDQISSADTEEIVFAKPSQVGGTEALFNMLGWLIMQDPSPTLCVYPSDMLAERVVTGRIQPMLMACEGLRSRYLVNASTKTDLQFAGMTLQLCGSNSPANLSSFPRRCLFMDEIDKFPGASKKEANPIDLARERTKTYRNRKIYYTSTPTLRTGHIWRLLEEADVVKHFFVPCPHCGRYIELLWPQVKFPTKDNMSYADRAEFAVYVCQECGCVITDQHKPQMLRFGEWRAVRSDARRASKVAYWINTLYSPFVRFRDVVKTFLTSKDDPESLQNFVNSWLAEPWENTKQRTDAETVLERQTEIPALEVPAWAKMLTAGVDVQQDQLYYAIRAWGNYVTSQNIAHGTLANWAELERVMDTPFRKANGEQLMVWRCLVDSGYAADEVYDFCAAHSDWAMPCKGSNGPMQSHFKRSTVNRAASRAYGMPLILIDGDKYKDAIAGRLRRENGSGSWMVHAGCDREYAEQIASEQKVQTRVGGVLRDHWQLRESHGDNHWLDCEVYAFAAADTLEVRLLHLQDAAPAPKRPASASAEEENDWLGGSGDWLPGGDSWI